MCQRFTLFPEDTSSLKINKKPHWFIWSVCVCVMDAWLQKTRRQTGNVPALPLNPATVCFISCGPCPWSNLYLPTRILFKHCCHRDDYKKIKCLGRSGHPAKSDAQVVKKEQVAPPGGSREHNNHQTWIWLLASSLEMVFFLKQLTAMKESE